MSTLYVNAIEPRTGSTVTFKPNLAITGSLKAGRFSGSTGQSNVVLGDLIVGSYGGTAASLYVSGNLTVKGTTTAISTTNTIIKDSLIELNNGVSSNSNDCGMVIERGSTGDNAIFMWDESADTFQVGTTTATGASTGNLTVTDAAFKAGSLDISGPISALGIFNPQTITRTTVPSNTNGVLYGPVTIGAGEQLEISAGSVVKIEDLLR
tara:strand:+ start:1382 stop:2008 length:627 start_codon:yes stop_codon:yes gene_type:complete